MDRDYFHAIGEFMGGFPPHYLVIDCETTGLDDQSHLIVEVGWAEIEAGAIIESGSAQLDWSRQEGIDFAKVAFDLSQVQEVMRRRGSEYPITPEQLKKNGVEPTMALTDIAHLIDDADRAGLSLVGHNIWAFDRLFLNTSFARFTKTGFRIPEQRIWDTGLIEKARMLGIKPSSSRGPRSRIEWYNQVRNDHRRVRFNLSNHCNQVYGLGVDIWKAHTAEYDCVITARLLEATRHVALGEEFYGCRLANETGSEASSDS